MEISQLYHKFQETSGISTDTRKIYPDCMFVALKGEKFNANEFALQALEKGAKYVVVSELFFDLEAYPTYQNQVILVPDTLEALQKLANYYRKTFQIPVLAVGGSNGKTTTKELIFRVLSIKYKTFATPGNLNNHIGVPLSLLQMPRDTEMAVIEIGANHEGETAELCQIAEPNFGLLTNIGLDHLEGFGSLEGVARANSELYYYLFQNRGKIFLNTTEEHLVKMTTRFSEKVTYPQAGDYFSAKILGGDFFVRYQTEKGEIVDTQLFGSYNFNNIASALCVGKYFEVPSELANQAVAEYAPANNRSQIIQKGSSTILLDAYNANPSSMEQALLNFAKIKAEKKMVILGSMFELGEYSDSEHQKLGELVARLGFDTVVFFGNELQNALPANPKAYFFLDKFSLHNWLHDFKAQNYHILIKGSRGVSLETVLQFIDNQ
jgi:UDP-N-acetylmuramoyl-tripeptide--D-alanyl-D-alanine ligase